MGAWAQEKKINLFKVVTVKDEIVIGLSADELKAAGGTDAGAVAHALAQKGDMTMWQYNVGACPLRMGANRIVCTVGRT
jgi:hypothetical protein